MRKNNVWTLHSRAATLNRATCDQQHMSLATARTVVLAERIVGLFMAVCVNQVHGRRKWRGCTLKFNICLLNFGRKGLSSWFRVSKVKFRHFRPHPWKKIPTTPMVIFAQRGEDFLEDFFSFQFHLERERKRRRQWRRLFPIVPTQASFADQSSGLGKSPRHAIVIYRQRRRLQVAAPRRQLVPDQRRPNCRDRLGLRLNFGKSTSLLSSGLLRPSTTIVNKAVANAWRRYNWNALFTVGDAVIGR